MREESFPAGLGTGELRFVEESDPKSAKAKQASGGRAGDAPPDDDDIEVHH
jgi:hypothetical protein